MYGTRGAARNWEETCRDIMVELGFRQGRSSGSVFFHPERRVRTVIHGDDFLSSADRADLRWLKGNLERKLDIKTTMMGPAEGEVKEMKILNRIVRWTENGITYEAGPRHAEIILESMGLENANSIKTPGGGNGENAEDDEEELGEEARTKFRAIAARCNYLAIGRPDLQYAAKEACRRMSCPAKGDIQHVYSTFLSQGHIFPCHLIDDVGTLIVEHDPVPLLANLADVPKGFGHRCDLEEHAALKPFLRDHLQLLFPLVRNPAPLSCQEIHLGA